MDITKIFEDKGKLGLYRKLIMGFMVVFVVADVFVERHHPHFFFDSIPGFNALLGIVAAFVIISLAVGLGPLLRRPIDHYDDKNDKRGEDN